MTSNYKYYFIAILEAISRHFSSQLFHPVLTRLSLISGFSPAQLSNIRNRAPDTMKDHIVFQANFIISLGCLSIRRGFCTDPARHPQFEQSTLCPKHLLLFHETSKCNTSSPQWHESRWSGYSYHFIIVVLKRKSFGYNDFTRFSSFIIVPLSSLLVKRGTLTSTVS